MSSMPSGREIHATKIFVPPKLEPSIFEAMRAAPDRADDYGSDESSDEEKQGNSPVGAFPGTKHDYSNSSNSKYY